MRYFERQQPRILREMGRQRKHQTAPRDGIRQQRERVARRFERVRGDHARQRADEETENRQPCVAVMRIRGLRDGQIDERLRRDGKEKFRPKRLFFGAGRGIASREQAGHFLKQRAQSGEQRGDAGERQRMKRREYAGITVKCRKRERIDQENSPQPEGGEIEKAAKEETDAGPEQQLRRQMRHLAGKKPIIYRLQQWAEQGEQRERHPENRRQQAIFFLRQQAFCREKAGSQGERHQRGTEVKLRMRKQRRKRRPFGRAERDKLPEQQVRRDDQRRLVFAPRFPDGAGAQIEKERRPIDGERRLKPRGVIHAVQRVQADRRRREND